MSKLKDNDLSSHLDLNCIEEARLRANCGLNIECECFNSIAHIAQEKDEISQIENRSIAIALLMLLGLVLLNFWVHMPQMSASLEDLENNSAKSHILDE